MRKGTRGIESVQSLHRLSIRCVVYCSTHHCCELLQSTVHHTGLESRKVALTTRTAALRRRSDGAAPRTAAPRRHAETSTSAPAAPKPAFAAKSAGPGTLGQDKTDILSGGRRWKWEPPGQARQVRDERVPREPLLDQVCDYLDTSSRGTRAAGINTTKAQRFEDVVRGKAKPFPSY